MPLLQSSRGGGRSRGVARFMTRSGSPYDAIFFRRSASRALDQRDMRFNEVAVP